MGIKVRDVAFVRFQAPDLDEMQSFFEEFGLHVAQRTDDTLYLRGTDDDGYVHVTHLGPEARFIGFAFEAASVDELHELAAHADFSDVEALDGPGGGNVVRATDPNGFQVEVVAGRGSIGALTAPAPEAHNDAFRHARTGVPLRLSAGPSHVKRLGHCVLEVLDFRTTEAWYKQHFGLLTSDEIRLDETTALGAFLRCDRGDEFVDHHTLFLLGIGRAGFNHAAFEVADFDDLMRGHSHLAAHGRHAQWGIGRHFLGSQIYDYWLDPHGHMVEHWTDGDLFDNTAPPGIASVGTLLGSQWGPTHGGPPA